MKNYCSIPQNRLKAIEIKPYCIEYFSTEATPEERLVAIRRDGTLIRFFIKSATSKERLEAARENGISIGYFIDTATSEEKWKAINSNPSCISLFNKTATLCEKKQVSRIRANRNREKFNSVLPEYRISDIWIASRFLECIPSEDYDEIHSFIESLTLEEKIEVVKYNEKNKKYFPEFQ